MADTPRTRTALLELAPDNTSGQITPQDLRDMLVSILEPYTFDVRGDGAVGDGSTSDKDAIQDTLDRIADAGAGTMILPANFDFRCSGLSFTGDKLTIRGHGATLSSDSDSSIIIDFDGCQDIKVYGLVFRCNGANGDSNRIAMRFKDGCKSVHIEKCEFDKCVGTAISITDTATVFDSFDYTIEKCRFIGTLINAESASHEADVVYNIGGGRVRHLNNTHLPDASNPSLQGITIAAGEGRTFLDVLVDGNIMHGHQWRGVSVSDEDPESTFDTGIVQIINNNIKHCDRQAIKTKFTARLIVTGNYCEDTDNDPETASLRGAINCHSASHFIISHNEILDGGTDGIRVEGAGDDFQGNVDGTRRSAYAINGNVIESCAGAAIMVSQFAYDVSLAGNVSRNCSYHIRVDGASTARCRNVSISGGTGYNVGLRHVYADYCDRVSVVGGVYDISGDHGMLFQNCTDVLVNSAQIHEADGDGIVLDTVSTAMLNGNMVQGSGRYGLNLLNSPTNVSVIGNIFAGSTTAELNGTPALAASNVGISDT